MSKFGDLVSGKVATPPNPPTPKVVEAPTPIQPAIKEPTPPVYKPSPTKSWNAES